MAWISQGARIMYLACRGLVVTASLLSRRDAGMSREGRATLAVAGLDMGESV